MKNPFIYREKELEWKVTNELVIVKVLFLLCDVVLKKLIPKAHDRYFLCPDSLVPPSTRNKQGHSNQLNSDLLTASLLFLFVMSLTLSYAQTFHFPSRHALYSSLNEKRRCSCNHNAELQLACVLFLKRKQLPYKI